MYPVVSSGAKARVFTSRRQSSRRTEFRSSILLITVDGSLGKNPLIKRLVYDSARQFSNLAAEGLPRARSNGWN